MTAPRTLNTSPQSLIQQSFSAQAHGEAREAIRLMKAALWFAKGEEASQIRDTLVLLYIAENDVPSLEGVLRGHSGELSPELVKAALALLRDQELGLLKDVPPQCERAAVLKRMRECFDAGHYDVPSALFLLSMLLQIRQTDLALELTHSLFDAQCSITEGVLAKVLAAVLAAGGMDEAEALLEKAAKVNRLTSRALTRLATLIDIARNDNVKGMTWSQPSDGKEDKVLNFIGWRFRDQHGAVEHE